MIIKGSRQWQVLYKNYKGVISTRTITIHDFSVRATPHHPGSPQLIMHVYDHDRRAKRDYAARDVIKWFG